MMIISGLRDRLRFKRVDKLVGIAVLTSVLITWAVLVGFDALRIFVSEANSVGQGQYTLGKAATYVLLTLPRRMYEWFCYAAMIGTLMGLGSLASTSELIALRAAGLSKLRICASAVFALSLLTALVALVGETIGPLGEQKARSLQLVSKAKDIAIAKGGGLWARDGTAVINAKRARTRRIKGEDQVELSDVRVFEFTPEGQLSTLSLAKTAIYARSDWTMQDVRRTEFKGTEVSTTIVPNMHWASGLDPRVLPLSIEHPEYMATRDLARNIDYLERNQQDASTYKRAYWARIFYPLNVLVLAFCAVPFAFGALRTGGLGKRLFLGMVLAVSYAFLQQSIVSVGAVYGFDMALTNVLPSIVLIMLAAIYFRRSA